MSFIEGFQSGFHCKPFCVDISKFRGIYSFSLNSFPTEPEDVFKMLRALTSGTPAGPHFLSVMQHLLLIRDDFFARPQYFKLVDKCVSQIVLHRGGLDPDFHYTRKFTIDVDGIIG